MEEKNKGKLVIWLLVIIIIFLLVAVGTLLYKVSTNGTQIMGGTNNTAGENVQNNNVNVGNINKLTDDRVLELAKRVLENGRGTPDEVIKVLFGDYIKTTGEKFNHNSCDYSMTNVNYSDFKNETLKVFSENYFNKLNSFKGMVIAIERNGKVAILQGGWSGTMLQVKSVKLDKTENDTYYYTVNVTMQAGDSINDVSYNMVIKSVNGNYVIDELEQNIQQNAENNENNNKLTDDRALELAKRVLENGRGSSDSVVKVMFGYEVSKNGKTYTDTVTGSTYNLTDLGYNKFKNQVLQSISEKYFEELNNFKGRKIVIEKDGYLGILEGTWSGTVHQVKSIKLDKTENDTYYYTVNTSMQTGDSTNDESYNMVIKLVDGNYVIDSLESK